MADRAEELALEAYPDKWMKPPLVGLVIPKNHERNAFVAGYHQAEKDIGKSLVRFFRDNITFDAHDGLIVDIPTFFDLIYECSKAIGIDLMPIYKNNR